MDSQRDSQVADVAVPKAEPQGDSPVDGVAVSAEAELAIQKEIISRMARVDVPASDWNNRMRELIRVLVGIIPEVGEAASFILGILWPENEVDIFEAIKQDIENLVDAKILAKELEERQNEIDTLHKVIEEYGAAQIVEKRSWLTRWIADSNQLNVKLQKSSNNVHFILPIVTVALLHLSGLRERLDHGSKIYIEDNSAVWKKDLEQTSQLRCGLLPGYLQEVEGVEGRPGGDKQMAGAARCSNPSFLHEIHWRRRQSFRGQAGILRRLE